MNRMNKYRSAMDKVEPPKELTEKTIHLMEAQKKPAPQPRRHGFRPVYGFAAAAACLFFLLAVPALLDSGSGHIFITELEAGTHTSPVELTDGFLLFEEPSGVFVSPGVHVGKRGVKEEWEIARYEEYIGRVVSLPYRPDGFSLKEESATVYLDEDGKVVRDHYQARYRDPDDGELTVSISSGVLPEGSDYDVPDNSFIRGEPLYAGYDPADGRYHVQFMRERIGYLLEARGISQEEFIMIVWHFFE